MDVVEWFVECPVFFCVVDLELAVWWGTVESVREEVKGHGTRRMKTELTSLVGWGRDLCRLLLLLGVLELISL